MLKFWHRNKQEPTKPEPDEAAQVDVEAEPVTEPEPEPEPEPMATLAEPEPEQPAKKGWLSRLREGLTKPEQEEAEPVVEQEPEPEPEPIVALKEAEPEPESLVEPEPEQPVKKGWLSRLREGLTKSTAKLTDGISGIFTKRKLDDEALEELEELLITADLGPVTAAKVTAELARTRFGKEVSPDEVRRTLAASIAQILKPVAEPLVIDPDAKPHVILVVGVNGAGKTTTIGKMAKQFRNEGKSVIIAAGDTFRAAAVQQLQVWGERSGCPVVSKETGADAAGLAFDALERARREKADILLIDTAGRLQNKANLMAELQKIIRVIKKMDPETPQSVLLVLDATTGQNAHSQVEVFGEMVNVTGLIVTKLDGSARGGVLVALAEKYGLPVHLIGVGESLEDMRPFEAESFARSLMGLES